MQNHDAIEDVADRQADLIAQVIALQAAIIDLAESQAYLAAAQKRVGHDNTELLALSEKCRVGAVKALAAGAP